LPGALKAQFVSLGLSSPEAALLVDQPQLRSHFDAVFAKTKDAKRTSSLVLTQLVGFLKAQEKSLHEGPSADDLLALVEAIDKGTISANAGKSVLEKMVQTGKKPRAIIAEEGMQQISDTSAIEALVEKAIAANAKAIEAFKSGKGAALGAIVGWVMKESKGQANPKLVNEILMKKIGS
jgi:aspartyl-tRNA(Asn)/glutamyl-tRNA(Gln) amidotransferase subunit B